MKDKEKLLQDSWVIRIIEETTPTTEKLEAEYGSDGPSPQFVQGTMHYCDNTEVFCVCGKSACHVIIGNEAYLARCSECYEKYGWGKNEMD